MPVLLPRPSHLPTLPLPLRPCPAESAFLLEVLITAAARLIMPYVSPIQKALVSKLRGGSGPGILPTGLGGALPLGPAGSSNTGGAGGQGGGG